MGSIFNTPGTQQIINLLSTTFTTSFAATAADNGLIQDLDPAQGLASYDFCKKHYLVANGPRAKSINNHWNTWLNYFDANGGNAVRTAMVAALKNPAKYTSIEFFVYFSNAFSVTSKDIVYADGTCSLAVTAQTPTYDALP